MPTMNATKVATAQATSLMPAVTRKVASGSATMMKIPRMVTRSRITENRSVLR